MGKGGSRPSAPASQTVTQTNVPEYAEPYFTSLLDRAQAESLRKYQPFEGQRISDESGDVVASRDLVRDVAGTGIAGLPQAQQRAYQATRFTPEMFGTDQASQYMSPYMQNVVDVQKQQARLDFNRAQAARDAQAVQAGAFGGSRRAVSDALAGEGLQRQLADIQAAGQQKAFEQAQQQFERDRQAQFAGEKLGLGASELLANLGMKARAGDVESAQLLEKIGKDQQARQQAMLDLGYEDFVRQRDYPREQLQFLSSILRGVPITPSTETTKFQAYNPIQELLGTGIAGLGLYRGLAGG